MATIWKNGALVEIAEEALSLDTAGPGVSPPVRTYKADLWRRATDEETTVILAALEQQPLRKQRIFADAQYLDHADPDTAEFQAGLAAAFGEERAGELMAPST